MRWERGSCWIVQCQWHWQILMMLSPPPTANDDIATAAAFATNSNVRRLHQQLPS